MTKKEIAQLLQKNNCAMRTAQKAVPAQGQIFKDLRTQILKNSEAIIELVPDEEIK